ncbi:phosphoribosyltransferase family protein [Pyrobaculum aerophilum]|uniref:Phosphoribosyl transferase n=2 Tax=Pyrobaculum aerophilum TaxID=13773 RepID=Q8ZVX9_PYRAE|nr:MULTISPECIES: phosphoribosyltransferase family protein [Pyrobaculum]AAL63925.1 phosphoribosyl transferase [Pyrobaculum aerophilum str. IM2]MCX8137506.1 phosphoribosyltransferase family protein [Pyrobaculum aerophilum]RFA93911.1 adenine phosphoribosyltransferase [Pyrobaculum aerophilum]RFA96116.1 adenine phosphoribosyltransferase [Pyrobaculum aerophilum]HII46513.1 helix-turn-helix domain-containing protein [Pyrobaculum aerophilum]
MKRIEGIRMQLDAVGYLKSVKALLGITYKELAAVLGIPESVLSRYATGDMLPSVETAREMLEKLEARYHISSVIKAKFKMYDTYIDMSFVNMPEFWRLYEIYLSRRFPGLGVDVVLTAAADGIPLAVAAASRFEASLVVAKQYREPGVENYEYTYLREGRPVTLYVPAAQLKKGQTVFIVDDIARTGKTLKALINLASKAGARIVGASVLVARREVSIEADFPVDVLYTIE